MIQRKNIFFDYKQDCFIHLYQKDWEKLKKYNPAKHYFRPWLSVVVYRIFSKRKGDRATIVSKKVDIDNAICDYIDLSVIDIGKMDKIADNEIGSEMIKKVLKKKLEYQTNGTIAEELGIPPKKVSECLNRGIALLIGLGFEDYFEKKH